MSLSSTARSATRRETIFSNPQMGSDLRIPNSTHCTAGSRLPRRETHANSHDPNERPTKMGSDLRMTPLRQLPRPVLYNVIASMILSHSNGARIP
jgi:hypothetical protein